MFLPVFWTASLGLLIYYWRAGRLNASRDPTFIPPRIHDDDAYDEESTHNSVHVPRSTSMAVPVSENDAYDDSSNEVNSPFADPHCHSSTTAYNGYPTATPAGRPSLDAYGAFSDPAPSGFINPSGFSTGPAQPSQLPSMSIPDHGPRVSRTMQYADPYAAVRASLAGQGSPPSYESYSGYR